MKLNIIIQARCSSSRLPYKSLMPVSGYPLILLIVKRLRQKNFNIVEITEGIQAPALLAIFEKH